MVGKREGHLGALYDAESPSEVARLYDDWAESYEAEMARAGYRHPMVCLALLARHLPAGEGPILDAGAGTGLLGDWLGLVGFRNLEALDLSEGMLAIARKKNAYEAYHQLALGETLPFADGRFAGIVAAGVFTTGHVGVEGLAELLRICKPGGVVVLSVNARMWDGEFSEKVSALESAGKLRILEKTAPYLSMPGEALSTPSLSVAMGMSA